jgi:hypothetical protein
VHRLEVEYELSAGVRYSGDTVEFFARKSDLDNRSMDEQYFPRYAVPLRYRAAIADSSTTATALQPHLRRDGIVGCREVVAFAMTKRLPISSSVPT